jgi:hypothetical protein
LRSVLLPERVLRVLVGDTQKAKLLQHGIRS